MSVRPQQYQRLPLACRLLDPTIANAMRNEWRNMFVHAFGDESYEKKLALRIANARSAECGGLRPTQLFGYRPR